MAKRRGSLKSISTQVLELLSDNPDTANRLGALIVDETTFEGIRDYLKAARKEGRLSRSSAIALPN